MMVTKYVRFNMEWGHSTNHSQIISNSTTITHFTFFQGRDKIMKPPPRVTSTWYLTIRLQQPLQTRTSNHAQTTINTGSIEPLYTTCSHTQHTATSLCLSLSLFHSYELHYSIYLLYSPYTYSYLSIIVICFPGPPSYQRHLSKPTCEVRDPTQPRPSWYM